MQHTILIEKIINGGKGLGRLDNGMIVMVPFVLPGETVEVSETRRFTGHLEAELLRVLDPSPERIDPVCRYYGECGGCDLQHGSYPAQQQIKEVIVREALDRSGVSWSAECLKPIISSDNSYSYRHRIRLKLSGNNGPGFARRKSNRIVSIHRCEVAVDRINRALGEIHENRQTLSALGDCCTDLELLHSPADGSLTGLVHLATGKRPDWSSLQRLAALESLDEFLISRKHSVTPLEKGHRPLQLRQVFERNSRVRDYSLSWNGGCFSQVNGGQNEKLVGVVCELCGNLEKKKVLDLFCGIGNFTVPLALRGAEGMAVEQNGRSLHWAEKNMKDAGIETGPWEFVCGEVGEVLRSLETRSLPWDCVVCDPPRTGMGKGAGTLAMLGADRVIYVSCDPATLARDLKVLTKMGYTVEQVVPVDMFPQTHHIESASFLKKIDRGGSSH